MAVSAVSIFPPHFVVAGTLVYFSFSLLLALVAAELALESVVVTVVSSTSFTLELAVVIVTSFLSLEKALKLALVTVASSASFTLELVIVTVTSLSLKTALKLAVVSVASLASFTFFHHLKLL
jgi:hypothetical protein